MHRLVVWFPTPIPGDIMFQQHTAGDPEVGVSCESGDVLFHRVMYREIGYFYGSPVDQVVGEVSWWCWLSVRAALGTAPSHISTIILTTQIPKVTEIRKLRLQPGVISASLGYQKDSGLLLLRCASAVRRCGPRLSAGRCRSPSDCCWRGRSPC